MYIKIIKAIKFRVKTKVTETSFYFYSILVSLTEFVIKIDQIMTAQILIYVKELSVYHKMPLKLLTICNGTNETFTNNVKKKILRLQ